VINLAREAGHLAANTPTVKANDPCVRVLWSGWSETLSKPPSIYDCHNGGWVGSKHTWLTWTFYPMTFSTLFDVGLLPCVKLLIGGYLLHQLLKIFRFPPRSRWFPFRYDVITLWVLPQSMMWSRSTWTGWNCVCAQMTLVLPPASVFILWYQLTPLLPLFVWPKLAFYLIQKVALLTKSESQFIGTRPVWNAIELASTELAWGGFPRTWHRVQRPISSHGLGLETLSVL
jgi:hypothetical protein